MIYVMRHFKIKTKSNKMEYTARRFCMVTATLDLEPDLISMAEQK